MQYIILKKAIEMIIKNSVIEKKITVKIKKQHK